MNCCNVTEERRRGTGRFFGWFAKSYARTFRRGGLEKIQRLLLEGVRETARTAGGLEDASLLDVGCGVGALHITLLGEGAGTARGVDLAPKMLEQAAELARSRGLEGRVEYLAGDLMEFDDARLERADIALLDKVICCYEEPVALLERTAERTNSIIALSHPRDRLPIALVWKTQAFFARLLRFRFYPCWHPWPAVTGSLENHGFAEAFRARTFLWETVVFQKTG